MKTSYKYLINFIIVIINFTLSVNHSFGQGMLPASISMDPPGGCSGINNLITFRAGGVCPNQVVNWNISGLNFVTSSSGSNWIKGYFTTSGVKDIGFYYKGIFTNTACDITDRYFHQSFVIGESNPSAGTISGNLTICSGSSSSLTANNIKGDILGWEKKIPTQLWTAATIIDFRGNTLPSQYMDNETENYRIKVGSSCAPAVYAYATVTVINSPQPTAGNLAGSCGKLPEVVVTSSSDPGKIVYHQWFETGQSTPFYSVQAVFKDYGNNIYESRYIPGAVKNYEIATLVDNCMSAKTKIALTYQSPSPPPSNFNFFINTLNSSARSVNACSGESIDVSVSGTRVTNFKWFYPDNTNFDNDRRAIIITSGLPVGNNSIKIMAAFIDECGTSTPVTDYFTVKVTSPALTIANPNNNLKFCENENITFNSYVSAVIPSGGVYAWFLNNMLKSSLATFNTTLAPGNYDIYCQLTAGLQGCLTSKTLNSGTVTLKVLPKPGTPVSGNVTQTCSALTLSFSVSTNLVAGYTVKHAWYSALDQFIVDKPTSSPTGTVYISSFSPDPFPEISKSFKVSSRVIDGTFICESPKTVVTYTKNFIPPPPVSLSFKFNNSIIDTRFKICKGETIPVEVITKGIVNCAWTALGGYIGTGLKISLKPDLKGQYNYSVTGNYKDECINTNITSGFIIDVIDVANTLTAEKLTLCQTESINITATADPVNPLNSVYNWFIDGKLSSGNSLSTSLANLSPGDRLITCMLEADYPQCSSHMSILSPPLHLTVWTVPGLVIRGDTSLCQETSSLLTAESPAAISVIWHDANNGDVIQYGNELITPELKSDFSYDVSAFSESGCEVKSKITIHLNMPNLLTPKVPVLTKSANNFIIQSNNYGIPGYKYYWVSGPDNMDGFMKDQINPAEPGKDYFLRSKDYNGCWGPSVSIKIPDNATPVNDPSIPKNKINYIRRLTYKNESQEINNPYNLNISTVCLDGLGREIEKVSWKGSPGQNDIVQITGYNNLGMQSHRFLPYASESNDGLFKENPYTELMNFYSSAEKVAHSNYPFSMLLSDGSPLKRQLEEAGPGETWVSTIGTTNAKTIHKQYSINRTEDKVILWQIQPDRLYISGYYIDGTLIRNITSDENGFRTIEFTDKMQRTILKKSQVDKTGIQWAETYFIYDEKNNLRFVIQPEAVRQANEKGTAYILIEKLNENKLPGSMIFQYEYDERNRIIAKKIPGSDWILMVYDPWDRLVFTQDGNQRKNNEWLFTKFDCFNRPVITGIKSIAETTASLKLKLYSVNYKRYEEKKPDEIFGYSLNQAFPIVLITEILSVTYYDDYSYPHASLNKFKFHPELKNTTFNPLVKGQITGSMTRILNDNIWLKSVNFYDDRYRVIQTISENHLGGVERNSQMIEKLSGNILESRATYLNPLNKKLINTISKVYTYDHNNSILEIQHSIARNVIWKNLVNAASTGDSLISNSTAGWGLSGAASEEAIPENSDGWVEFTAIQNNNNLYSSIGLSDKNPDANWTSIKYLFQLLNGSVFIRESGSSNKLTQAFIYKIGDKFRIERKDNAILYFINNNLIYKNSNAIKSALLVDVALYVKNAIAYDVRICQTGSVKMISNEYNDRGELTERNLHQLRNGKFMQSIDYRYNIRGWLTNINNDQLANEPQNNDDSNDFFGMELFYDQKVNNQEPQYNGNISAASWTNSILQIKDLSKTKLYTCQYDPMNRLLAANYIAGNQTGWNAEIGNYSATGFAYDFNGNIQKMNRNGFFLGQQKKIDQLTYGYMGNRLIKVEDLGINSGFSDGVHLQEEYIYDNNGNMITDKNKAINNIEYNFLNLPSRISFESGNFIRNSYNASGVKLRMESINRDSSPLKKIDYTGEFIYSNDTLQQILTDEGRIIDPYNEGFARFAEYQYYLKDQLGNTRVTFRVNKNIEYKATFEPQFINAENTIFPGYNNLVKIQGNIYDHTDISSPGNSERLSGANGEIIGLAKSLAVGIGDTVRIKAFAKYFNPTTKSTQIAGSLLGAITSAFGINPVAEQQVVYNTFSGLFSTGSLIGAGDLEDVSAPKAFLNYLLFDESLKLVQMGFDQVDLEARENGTDVKHDSLSLEIFVRQPGFIYIYISNENDKVVDVFFDDITITHIENPVIQTDDYYPFGMSMEGLSYLREGEQPNRFKYNGKEMQDDFGLNWYDYGARFLDPQIGRFITQDRFSEMYRTWSPYNYCKDNPIKYVDINGDSIVKTTRENNTIVVENSPKPGEDKNYNNTLTLDGKSINQSDISDYSVSILNDAMNTNSEQTLTITSGKRDAKNQARAMYNNLVGKGKGKGVEAQKLLYGNSPGKYVINVYIDYKGFADEFKTDLSSNTKLSMENKIIEVGPSNVSNHCSNDPKLNVFDIDPSSLGNYESFQNSLGNDGKIRKVIPYPEDPGIHIEIINP